MGETSALADSSPTYKNFCDLQFFLVLFNNKRALAWPFGDCLLFFIYQLIYFFNFSFLWAVQLRYRNPFLKALYPYLNYLEACHFDQMAIGFQTPVSNLVLLWQSAKVNNGFYCKKKHNSPHLLNDSHIYLSIYLLFNYFLFCSFSLINDTFIPAHPYI